MTIKKACLPFALGISSLILSAPALTAEEEVKMAPEATVTKYRSSVFSGDPFYDNRAYDYAAQLEIYGGKSSVDTPRPLLELGRRIYDKGTFPEESYIFGKLNPVSQQFVVYGDWRTAAVYNGKNSGLVSDRAVLATKLTLELDYKLTATERLHVGITPLDRDGDITRYEFGGGDPERDETVADFRANSAFLEGDLGAIVSGFTGHYTSWDMPFAIGLMPLQFQNGIWVDDAFTGLAVSVVSKNSKALNISNYDVTFFAGFDKVNSPLLDPVTLQTSQRGSNVFGLATFLDANQGYWELDYGFTQGQDDLDDQSYHNVAIGFTRRYGGWLSNSVRVITNFGQDRKDLPVGMRESADGTLYLLENSLITSKPSTLIPYLNLFAGVGRPQALARAAAAGGVLKNVGITFESDNMTGYPTLNATGGNTVGGAIGIQYLFGLDRQIVVELAGVDLRDNNKPSAIADRQAAVGIRYQQNLSKAWLLRMDAIYSNNKLDATDFSGGRIELRRKF
ncbi:MAG: hypothetical protein ACI89D_000095 [Bermanella sp.]|jgi:hypothetical protein